MNHAPGAVTPPDAEVVQVGDAIGQRAERRGLVQGAVWPVGAEYCLTPSDLGVFVDETIEPIPQKTRVPVVSWRPSTLVPDSGAFPGFGSASGPR
jgi:hypothetical protein